MVWYAEPKEFEISLMNAREFQGLWFRNYKTQLDFFDGRTGVENVVKRLGYLQSTLLEYSIIFPDTLNGRAAYARALAEVFGFYESAGKFLHERQHAERAIAMGLKPQFGIVFIQADGENVRGNICHGRIHAAPFVIDDLTSRVSDFSVEQIRRYLLEQKKLDWSSFRYNSM